jgi:hypothetical protein
MIPSIFLCANSSSSNRRQPHQPTTRRFIGQTYTDDVDRTRVPGPVANPTSARKALDRVIRAILDRREDALAKASVSQDQREQLAEVMTPFFPDILVCSQVMGEGVDLQRCCHYVIHHDLDWNPSKIEQRTGTIDWLRLQGGT